MKTYVRVTGAVFGGLTLVHLWRVVALEPHLVRDPWFLGVTLASGALCFWAWCLLWRQKR